MCFFSPKLTPWELCERRKTVKLWTGRLNNKLKLSLKLCKATKSSLTETCFTLSWLFTFYWYILIIKHIECVLSFFSIKDCLTQKGLTYMSLISLSWYSRYLVSSYVLSIELLSLARLCEVSSAVAMAAANSKKSWCWWTVEKLEEKKTRGRLISRQRHSEMLL